MVSPDANPAAACIALLIVTPSSPTYKDAPAIARGQAPGIGEESRVRRLIDGSPDPERGEPGWSAADRARWPRFRRIAGAVPTQVTTNQRLTQTVTVDPGVDRPVRVGHSISR